MKKKDFFIGVFATLVIQILIFFIIFINAWNIVCFNKEINTDVAVLEGWICDHSIKEAADYIIKNNIKTVFISGNHINKQKKFFPKDNYAQLGEILLKNELKGYICEIIPVPVNSILDRTLNSAREVIKYIKENEKEIYDIIILTEENHSRRTFLSYKKVSHGINVGIHPLSDGVLNKDNWKDSSDGIKRLLTETIALFYNSIRRKI